MIITRTSGRHVGAETESRNIDHQIVRWKVVEDIAFCFAGKHQVARNGHQEAAEEREGSRHVRDGVKSDSQPQSRPVSGASRDLHATQFAKKGKSER